MYVARSLFKAVFNRLLRVCFPNQSSQHVVFDPQLNENYSILRSRYEFSHLSKHKVSYFDKIIFLYENCVNFKEMLRNWIGNPPTYWKLVWKIWYFSDTFWFFFFFPFRKQLTHLMLPTAVNSFSCWVPELEVLELIWQLLMWLFSMIQIGTLK